MPGRPIAIGPFTGGLNNISLSGEAQDNEVVDLINMEVTVDGALTSRPPITVAANSTLPSTNTIGWEVLGIYRITTTEWYLVISVPKNGTTNTDTTVKAYLNGIIGTGETVYTIKESVGIANRVTSMVQFKDFLYFNVEQGASDTGFKWQKGNAVGGTAIASMPRGSIMVTWKTRIWIAGTGSATFGDRIWFSTIDSTGAKPDDYATANNFDVAPGEGGFITAMIPSFNNLIVFKNDGTWRYTFPADPAKGAVEKVSGDVGAATKKSVLEFENYIYVYDQGRVHELVNSNYTQINRFVRFTEDPLSVDSSAPGVEMSVVSRRLVLRYYNALYVFNIDTKAWSQWRSVNGTPGAFTELPGDSSSANASTYIAPSRGTLKQGSVYAPRTLIKCSDIYPDQPGTVEAMDCSFQTKSYDYRAPSNFKRLYWAGMDVKASRSITVETRPVSRERMPTWGDLEGYTWGELEQGLWGNPLSWINVSVAEIDLLPEDRVPSENGRYFKKFGASIRFRQISYVVKMTTLGNLATGPIKFFTITTYVNTKQEAVDAST